MKKKYFFGYLFVRVAKGLALLVLITGIGFAIIQYSQADIAATSVTYRVSPVLQRTLAKLKDTFSSAEQIVSSFNASNQSPKQSVRAPRFPPRIDTEADFDRVGSELTRIDQDRQQLKQSVVNRFEASVSAIEEKLRAHAAGLQALPSATPASPGGSPVTVLQPTPTPSAQPQSLFSPKLGNYDVSARMANLKQRKEFLKVLATKAENTDNRAKLDDAAEQLEQLSKLLPEEFETIREPESGPEPTTPKEPKIEQARKLILSERVAGQLQQLRSDIHQIILSSWALDDAFEQAADNASVERDKCRVAALARKGIWLSALSKIASGLLAAALASFLILVFADLVQTLLDTATNTGVIADATTSRLP